MRQEFRDVLTRYRVGGLGILHDCNLGVSVTVFQDLGLRVPHVQAGRT